MPTRGESLLKVAHLPGKMVESASDSVFGFLEEYFLTDQKQFAKERLQTLPLHEVEIGRKAIGASKRALQDSIALSAAAGLLRSKREAERSVEKRQEAKVFRNIGYGTMKMAVVRAVSEEDHEAQVPEHIVKEAVMRSANLGADPNRDGFMRPGKSEIVSEVFDKFDNITVFPGSK